MNSTWLFFTENFRKIRLGRRCQSSWMQFTKVFIKRSPHGSSSNQWLQPLLISECLHQFVDCARFLTVITGVLKSDGLGSLLVLENIPVRRTSYNSYRNSINLQGKWSIARRSPTLSTLDVCIMKTWRRVSGHLSLSWGLHSERHEPDAREKVVSGTGPAGPAGQPECDLCPRWRLPLPQTVASSGVRQTPKFGARIIHVRYECGPRAPGVSPGYRCVTCLLECIRHLYVFISRCYITVNFM